MRRSIWIFVWFAWVAHVGRAVRAIEHIPITVYADKILILAVTAADIADFRIIIRLKLPITDVDVVHISFLLDAVIEFLDLYSFKAISASATVL